MQLLYRLSRLLASNASLFIIAISIFTFFMPDTFGWVRGTMQTVILGIIMANNTRVATIPCATPPYPAPEKVLPKSKQHL